MRIAIYALPIEPGEFHTEFTNYLLQRAAHRLTEGEEAPFPKFEIFRVMFEAMERGEPVEVFDDRDPATINPPMPPTEKDIQDAIAQRTTWARILDVFAPNRQVTP